MKSLLLASALAVAVSASAQAAEIGFVKNGQFAIAGDIVHGDFKKFQDATKYLPPGSTVWLSSDGGMLSDAIEIGQEVRKQKFVTAVWDKNVCASACAIIWLAGTTRYIHGKAAVGFHAAYDVRTGLETGMMNAVLGAYMRDLGYSFPAIIFATKAGPADATWVHEDAAKAGIQWNLLK